MKRPVFPSNNQCISIITLDGMLSLFREEEQLGAGVSDQPSHDKSMPELCTASLLPGECRRRQCFSSQPWPPGLVCTSSIRHQQLGFTSNASLSSTGVALRESMGCDEPMSRFSAVALSHCVKHPRQFAHIAQKHSFLSLWFISACNKADGIVQVTKPFSCTVKLVQRLA